jgi:GTPase SAR1 family protein
MLPDYEKVVKILLGNKCDLDQEKQVSTEEIKSLAEEKNFIFFDVSAKEGTNIGSAFKKMALLIK